MERILNQTHNKYTFIYACSRLFERAAYYGLRALIVLYMIVGSLKMSNSEALKIYGWLSISFIFSQILGALLGDLLIGNKKAIIIGGILQALGALSFFIPSVTSLYIGLALVSLGGGLYTPNIISHFGKLYLKKTKLLDAAFTLFYLAVNLGSFFGILVIGYIGETFGWNLGFATAGVFMIISILFPIFSKESNTLEFKKEETSIQQKILKVAMAFILIGLFWAFYEISFIRTMDIKMDLSDSMSWNVPKVLWQSLDSIFIFPISIVFIFLWTYLYNNQFVKLTLGFTFGALSFGILFFIPEMPTDQHFIIYLISLLFLGISEIHIAPIIHSLLTRYTNPKYLAIIISLAFIPTRLFSYITALFNDRLFENPVFALQLAFIGMVVISIGLVIYIIINKNLSG